MKNNDLFLPCGRGGRETRDSSRSYHDHQLLESGNIKQIPIFFFYQYSIFLLPDLSQGYVQLLSVLSLLYLVYMSPPDEFLVWLRYLNWYSHRTRTSLLLMFAFAWCVQLIQQVLIVQLILLTVFLSKQH